MRSLLKKYWFLGGLLLVFVLTLADPTDAIALTGRWLRTARGPDAVIFLVFLFSGFLLDPRQIRDGLTDIKGTLIALVLIFIVAPLYSLAIGHAPFDTGVKIGLFLVAVMPTTLSSGVVMTGASGGNSAHALLITVSANILSVATIAITLPMLLHLSGESAAVALDKLAVIKKIGFYVLLPLMIGLAVKYFTDIKHPGIPKTLSIINQCLILVIVWMGVAQAKPVLFTSSVALGNIIGLVLGFHLLMLATAFGVIRMLSIPRGRMESILFMGSQKTLPLSIILQVALFPAYGQALLVCVLHHLVSLFVDGFLVGRLGCPHRR